MHLVERAGIPDRRFLHDFVEFPYRLYAACPNWIPGLKFLDKEALSQNPALAFHDVAFFLAMEQGQVLGRIGVFKDRRPDYADRPAKFGWLDFVDDPEVSSALLAAATGWAVSQGARELHGPLGFTDFDKAGVLMTGFDQCASFHSSYNYPYYQSHLLRHGYQTEVEWAEWLIDSPGQIPESLAKVAQASRERHGMRILERKSIRDIDNLIIPFFELLNESYRSLYGFTKFEPEQMAWYRKQWLSLLPKKFLSIAVRPDGSLAGFALALPSLNSAARKSNGAILPLGFLRFAKSLYFERDCVDLLLVAVDNPSKNTGVLALITEDLLQHFLDLGITQAHAHWQMSQNGRIINLWKRFPAKCHKRRACFKKAIP